MKERYTYRELAKLTGLPDSVLCRYVRGEVCPNIERTEELSRLLLKIARLYDLIAQKIERDSEGYMDASRVVTDPEILELGAHHAVDAFKQAGVTKTVAASVDGIPLGTLAAQHLGVSIVIAKGEREAGIRGFLEDQYDAGGGLLSQLYLPRSAFSRRDRVLVVDGVIRSHQLHTALRRMLVEKAKVQVTGIFTLITVKEEWAAMRELYPEAAEAILQVPERISVNGSQLGND